MKKFFFLAVFATACVMLSCSSSKMSSKQQVYLETVRLDIAVMNDDLEDAKAALAAGADVNYIDINQTPIFHAESPEMLSLLIKYGADVNFKNGSGLTPLEFWCATVADPSAEAEGAKMLLEAGADAKTASYALYASNLETAKLLVEYGADVNFQDEEGRTPLIWKIIRGEDLETVQFFLDAGADPDLRDKSGKSAREHAAECKCCEITSENLAIKMEDPTREPTKQLLNAILAGNKEAMKDALAAGADPNGLDRSKGMTLLSVCVLTGDVEGMKILLKAGAEVNAVNLEGGTALHIATVREDIETQKLLLDAGADPNIPDYCGESAIFHCSEPEAVMLLIEHRADINFRVNTEKQCFMQNGTTPLMWLVQCARDDREHIEAISTLLEAGADPDARDAEGKSAKDYANEKGIERIKKLFR